MAKGVDLIPNGSIVVVVVVGYGTRSRGRQFEGVLLLVFWLLASRFHEKNLKSETRRPNNLKSETCKKQGSGFQGYKIRAIQ